MTDGTTPGAAAAGSSADSLALVRELWCELLDLTDPPTDVSFFELGGYSQAALTLAARLQERLGFPVPVADLFEHVTIEEQATLVEQLYQRWLDQLAS
ncbi:Phosphopantetheine attachment site [Jatrophihabitans endophyticus]|uniref:Phosphopantetheine attachment site n=1 Tax=Jatrophihabitans endophyticus TaxID=1206085 RepID=A0A1M5CPF4_9ACTN|nr:acyl carrier protein [Jatrophihabitans endophyticus]SHF56589.1 Phosphopantetheine attachment site [Jatrophihabitans endophyticus]